jgi:hypothetical protein
LELPKLEFKHVKFDAWVVVSVVLEVEVDEIVVDVDRVVVRVVVLVVFAMGVNAIVVTVCSPSDVTIDELENGFSVVGLFCDVLVDNVVVVEVVVVCNS